MRKKFSKSFLALLMSISSLPYDISYAEDIDETLNEENESTQQEQQDFSFTTSTEEPEITIAPQEVEPVIEVVPEQPAITLEEPVEVEEPVFYCGKEEHVHSDECYEVYLTLICEKEHIHDDTCFTEYRFLTCEQEEHLHDEYCEDPNYIEPVIEDDPAKQEEKELIEKAIKEEENYYLACGKEEHEHTPECFEKVEILNCEENHEHNEECYIFAYRLHCEKEEHIHTKDCVSIKEEVVEEEEVFLHDDEVVQVEETPDEPLLQTNQLLEETKVVLSGPLRAAPEFQEPVEADGITLQNVTLKWLSSSSGTDWQAKYDDLILTPTNDVVPNQQFQIDLSLSGKGTIPAGSVEIIIPAYIWKDQAGNEPGLLTLAIPEEPSTKNDFAWKRVGDAIVMTNAKTISAAAKYMIQGTFRMTSPDPNANPSVFTSTYAHEMYGTTTVDPDAPYHGISDDLFAIINVETPRLHEVLTMTSNTLNAQLTTFVEVADVSKRAVQNKVYTELPAHLPEEFKPDNPDDYIYVQWYVSATVNGNQEYDMYLSDTVSDLVYNVSTEEEITVEGVMLGGSTDEETVVSEDHKNIRMLLFSGYNLNDAAKADISSKTGYVWTAYKKADFPGEGVTYRLNNDVIVDVTGQDDLIRTEASASATVAFRMPVVWKIDKVWNDDDNAAGNRPSSLNTWIYDVNQPLPSGYWKIVKNFTLNDENNWHAEWVDDGTITNYGIREQSWRAISNTYVVSEGWSDWVINEETGIRCRKHWWYNFNPSASTYNDDTHTWTLVNDYHEVEACEGSIPWVPDIAVLTTYKEATNHLNRETKATTDRDISLLADGKETTLVTYNITSTAIVAPYTLRDGGMLTNPDDYGFKDVEMKVEDQRVSFGSLEMYPNGALTEEDYEIRTVTLRNPYLYKKIQYDVWSRWNWTYLDETVPVELYGKRNGEWIHYADLDAAGNLTVYNGATEGGLRVVNLPDNVTHVYTTQKTKRDRITAGYNLGIVFKPSEKMVNYAQTLFESSDYAFTNAYNTERTFVYDSTGEEVLSLESGDRAYLHGRNYRLAVDLDKEYIHTETSLDNRYIDFEASLTLNQQSNITNYTDYLSALQNHDLPFSESGVFYDLLPEGMTVDLATVEIDDGEIVMAEAIENYQNSGRTLVIIKARLTDVSTYKTYPHGSPKREDQTYPDEGYYRGHTVTFHTQMTLDEARNRGLADLRNTAAYEADEPEFGNMNYWRGEPDDPTHGNHKESATAVRSDLINLMTNLDTNRDDPTFVYAQNTARMTEVDFSALTMLKKYVQVTGDDVWTTGHDNDVNVPEAGKYSYQIILTSGGDTTTKDIILLDSIENYTPMEITDVGGNEEYEVGNVISRNELSRINAQLEQEGKEPMQAQEVWYWKGYFRSVDVSELRAMGIDPVVYYSTTPGLDISHDAYNPEHEYDAVINKLQDPNGDWTTELPDDPSTVTAIAIDCRKSITGEDFLLEEFASIIAYFHMQAPTYDQQPDAFADENYNNFLNNAHAYNNVYMDITHIDDVGNTTHSYDFYDYTKVGIYSFDLEVEKIWDDDNDRDGIRPDSVDITLLRNGEPINRTITIRKEDDYKGKFEYVTMYDEDGRLYEYSIAEGAVEGYVDFSTLSNKTFTIRNTHTPERISLPFEKHWVSDEPPGWESNIPESIVLRLYEDGVFRGKQQRIYRNAENTWTGMFTGLLKYRDGGIPIEYTIEEIVPENFVVSYSDDTTEITNKYYPYGDIEVEKHVLNATERALENEFIFTISLHDNNGDELTTKYAYQIIDLSTGDIISEKEAWEGVGHGGRIHLKDNQKLIIKDLPNGTVYHISESSTPGFTLTNVENDNGTVKSLNTSTAMFTNTYASRGHVNLNGTKTLVGREIRRYAFRFELLDAERNVLYTSANQAMNPNPDPDHQIWELNTADINFSSLNFTEEDDGVEHIFYIREVDRQQDGYTYDTKEYKIHILPHDNGNGTMSFDVNYNLYNPETGEEGELVNGIVFDNTYEAEGSIALRAWKTIEARKLANNEFSFDLYDEDGNLLQTKKNNSEGAVQFDALHFTHKDVGKTFYYLIKEHIPGTEDADYDPSVIYDTSAHGYSIFVYDNGNGKLSFLQKPAEPIYEEETYTETDVIESDVITEHGYFFYGDGDVKVGKNWYQLLKGIFDELAKDDPEAQEAQYARFYLPENYEFYLGDYKFQGKLSIQKSWAGKPTYYIQNGFHVSEDRPSEGMMFFLYAEEDDYTGMYVIDLDEPAGARTVIPEIGTGIRLVGNVERKEPVVVGFDTEEAPLPIFNNKLKDGSLGIVKEVVDSPNADPNQEFKFRVKFLNSEKDLSNISWELAEPRVVTVTKVWENDTAEDRPEDITVYLSSIIGQSPKANTVFSITVPTYPNDTVPYGQFYVEDDNLVNSFVEFYNNYDASKEYKVRLIRDETIIEERVITPENVFDNGVTVYDSQNQYRWRIQNYMGYLINAYGDISALPNDRYEIVEMTNQNDYALIASVPGDWVDNGDNTWTYKFYVPNNTEEYTVYEKDSRIGTNTGVYTASNDINNQVSVVNNQATITNTFVRNEREGEATIDRYKWGTSYEGNVPIPYASARYFKRNNTLTYDEVIALNDAERVDDETTDKVIYRWLDGDTLYWWSNAENVYFADDCYYMFCIDGGVGFDVIDITGLNSSRTTEFSGMFAYNRNLKQIIGLETLDTSQATTLRCMFQATGIEEYDLSNFDTTNVTDMAYMFYENYSLKSVNLSSFDTSQVMYIDSMFDSCKLLEEIDLSSFETGNVRTSSYMFRNDENLRTVFVSDGWDLSNVTNSNSYYMFFRCENLPNYNASIIDKTNAHYGTGGYLTYKAVSTGLKNKNESIASTNRSFMDTLKSLFIIKAEAEDEPNNATGSNVEKISDNEYIVTIKANEKATFNNIPAGTAYQVYEETPDGWVLVEQSNISGTIQAITESIAEFKNRYQPGVTSVQFSGSKTLDNRPAEEDAFTFELLENGEVIESVKTLDGGFIQFSVITYEQPGTHTYTIREKKTVSNRIEFDEHEEQVVVEVLDNGEGGLTANITYDADGINFTNKTNPGSLKISKTTDVSTSANRDDEFTIKITFNNENGTPLGEDENIYWYKLDENGNPIMRTNNSFNLFNLFGKKEELDVYASEIMPANSGIPPTEKGAEDVTPKVENEEDNIIHLNESNKQNAIKEERTSVPVEQEAEQTSPTTNNATKPTDGITPKISNDLPIQKDAEQENPSSNFDITPKVESTVEDNEDNTYSGFDITPKIEGNKSGALRLTTDFLKGIGLLKTIQAEPDPDDGILDHGEEFTITYDATDNGEFDTGERYNVVKYRALASPITKYAHTDNINDNGTSSGSYANSLSTNTVVTIPGAASLEVTVDYKTESCCDWAYVWEGNHPEYTSDSIGTATPASPRLSGGRSTWTGTINGESATFTFRSDGSVTDYGYYAVVTGKDAEGNILYDLSGPGSVKEKEIIEGEYKEPTYTGTVADYVFQVFSPSLDEVTGSTTLIAQYGETIIDGGSYDGVLWRVIQHSDGSHSLVFGDESVPQQFTNRDRERIYDSSAKRANTYPWLKHADVIKNVKFVGEVKGQGQLPGLFEDLNKVERFDLEKFDTSEVTDFSYMFANVGTYFLNNSITLDISNFDTSKGTSFKNMFAGLKSSPNAENPYNGKGAISHIITSDKFVTDCATDLSGMFSGCSADNINEIIGRFNTSNVTDMSYMFRRTSAPQLDVSGFDTSNVTNMSHMFQIIKDDELDLSHFNTSKVKDMSYMFASDIEYYYYYESSYGSTTSLVRLNLTNFNYSNVENFDGMFKGTNFDSLITPVIQSNQPNTMEHMFENATINNIDMSKIRTTNATSLAYMFYGGRKKGDNQTLDIKHFDTSSVENLAHFFDQSKFTSVDISTWDTSKVKDFSYFANRTKINELKGLENLNTSSAESMVYTFGRTNLEAADVSGWDTSNVLDMRAIFSNANTNGVTGFEEWDVTNVRCFKEAFYYSAMPQLDLSKWNPTNLRVVASMFQGSKATYIDISSLDTRNIDMASYGNDDWTVQSGGRNMFESSYVTEIMLGPNFSFNGLSYAMSGSVPQLPGNKWTHVIDGLQKTPTELKGNYSANANEWQGLWSREVAQVVYDSADNSLRFYSPTRELELTDTQTLYSVGSGDTNVPWRKLASTITKVYVEDDIYPDYTGNWFNGFSNTMAWDLSKMHTENVKNMSNMFKAASVPENIVQGFDTSNVTDMTGMFQDAKAERIDLSGLDLSKVITMYQMFYNSTVTSVDFSDTNTESLSNMSDMFNGAKDLEIDPMPNINTTNVTTMRNLFNGNKKIKNYDFSHHTLSNVTTMENMFYLTPVETVNFTGCNTSKLINTSKMFYSGEEKERFEITGLDTSHVTNMSYMFYYVRVGEGNNLDFTWLDGSSVRNLSNTFAYVVGDVVDLTGFSTPVATDMQRMFACSYYYYYYYNDDFIAPVIKELIIPDLDTRNNPNRRNMFYYFSGKAVTLGENFSFGPGTENPLSIPNNAWFSKKWIRDDTLIGPYSPSEMQSEYIGEYAGRYIREPKYITFDPNGGHIDGDNKIEAARRVTLLSAADIKHPGYELLGWATRPDAVAADFAPGVTTFYQYTSYPNPIEYIPDMLYAVWKYDGMNGISVNHYQESIDGSKYNLVDTDISRGAFGTTVEVKPKEYDGFYLVGDSTPQMVTVPEDDDLYFEYYYNRNRYTISFNGNGATSGKMNQALNAVGGVSTTLPRNEYALKGALFQGWNTKPDGTGEMYLNQAQVLNLGGNGEHVVLYAQWQRNENELTPTEGVIYVKMKAGETIVIPDLPYGTTYTIEEIDLPTGWELDAISGSSGMIDANKTNNANVYNRYNATGEALLVAHKEMMNSALSEGQFTFELVDNNGTVLQRATNGPVDNEEMIPVDGGEEKNRWYRTGLVQFEPLSYTQADIGKTYTYTIREVNTNNPMIQYDSHIETVSVYVYDDGSGSLKTTVYYDSDEALFVNSLYPGTLKVSKNIMNATSAAEDTEFTYRLTLKDINGQEVPGSFRARIKHRDYNEEEEIVHTIYYSHTPNISDDGKANGSYANYLDYNDVVSAQGAKQLDISVTYETERCCDWVYVWEGNHPDYSANTSNYGGVYPISGTLGGNRNTWNGIIDGDSVTFTFRSDGSVTNYGYYAVIRAITNDPTTYDDIMIHSGETFALKGGETIEIYDLPHDTSYEVKEIEMPKGWELHDSTNVNGTIEANTSQSASFTNIYSTEGGITIEGNKNFHGGDISSKQFTFSLTDNNGAVISNATTDENGKFSFPSISYDQSDDGMEYTYYIREIIDREDTSVDEWDDHLLEVNVKVRDDGQGKLNTEVTYDNVDTEFHNFNLQGLAVEKEVYGSTGDKSKAFSFTLNLSGDYASHPITYRKTYANGESETGNVTGANYTFTLSHQDRIEFNGLVKGTHYEVIENDSNYDGYATTVDTTDTVTTNFITKRVSVSGTLDEDKEMKFKNDSDGIVPTGLADTWYYGLVILIPLLHFLMKKQKRKS